MKKTVAAAALVLAVSAPAVTRADVWILSGSGGIQATGATMTFGELQAEAFIVDTNNGSANTPTTDVLNGANGVTTATAAQLGQYLSGLGVTTTGQGGDNGTGAPESAMDNQLGYEFIVFKLPDNYAFMSLQLDSLSGGAGTGTGDADITAWIGGDDFTNFDDFIGNTLGNILGGPNTFSLSGTRFQQLNLKTSSTCAIGSEATNAAGTSGCNDVVYVLDTPAIESPAPAGSDAVGKWLIVGAALTVNGSNLVDRDDDVLITSLTANALPNGVPEPGTIALLGIALAGLGFTRRKRAVN